jgi:hypothetical protein
MSTTGTDSFVLPLAVAGPVFSFPVLARERHIMRGDMPTSDLNKCRKRDNDRLSFDATLRSGGMSPISRYSMS